MARTSKYWPIIRAIGNALTVPGTSIGPKLLTEIQDQVSTDDFQRDVAAALGEVLANTGEILAALRREGITVGGEELTEAAVKLAEALYLDQVARDYFYADFRGVEQVERFVPLELDAIFVDLKAHPERSLAEERERDEAERRVPEDDVTPTPTATPEETERRLFEGDARRLGKRRTAAESQPIDRILRQPGPAVLLGGPGSGKSTLVKRLARSCALGPETLTERYPELPWCLPVVVPIGEYDGRRGGRAVLDYVKDELERSGGPALVRAFEERWAEGECLVLLDGLDEVAESGRRIACAKAVSRFLQDLGPNRALVTSRPVGYSLCRVNVPCEHYVLDPFGPADVERFARQWCVAFDRATKDKSPDPQGAEREAQGLIEQINDHPHVADLARNPLMLTIIALVRRQRVTLPERRVELYEIALDTLIRSWNKARSLGTYPVGEDLSPEDTKEVWGEVAHWMHQQNTGAVQRSRLHGKLVEILLRLEHPRATVQQTAESYLRSASDRAGLLDERGAGAFAFMHQTFQEYLAALHLCQPLPQAVGSVLSVADDPRWHEVVRLAVGHISTMDRDTATALIERLLEEGCDALEPFVCRRLRLAAACVADKVRVKRRATDALIVRLCDRVRAVPHRVAVPRLCDALRSLDCVPGPEAVEGLSKLAAHEDGRARMTAARLLGLARDSAPAMQALERLEVDEEERDEVRAWAALGLYHLTGQADDGRLRRILKGLTSVTDCMKGVREPRLAPALVPLLRDGDPNVRSRAAQTLGAWGPQPGGLDPLIVLLRDDIVGATAAEALGAWGPQPSALDALLDLLANEHVRARYIAATTLGAWEVQPRALNTVVALLADSDTMVRSRAAATLAAWGPQSQAMEDLVALLDHDDPEVRFSAAATLGAWGHREQALGTLLALLDDDVVRARGAALLGAWGHKPEALETLVDLLRDDEPSVRQWAAATLVAWGHEGRGLGTLLADLSDDGPSYVRYGAAVRLGELGRMDQARTALLGLLRGQDRLVRGWAAATLAVWGRQPEALATFVVLLGDGDFHVHFLAVGTLSAWGPAGGVAAAVLALVPGMDDTERQLAARYLESCATGGWTTPDAATSSALVKAITPAEGDETATGAAREIIFGWLWNATGGTA